MTSMLRRLIGENIDLVANTDANLGMISADPAKIQQVVLNLVVNARDAMPEGGKLTIETSNFDFQEDYVKDHPVTQAGSYIMLAISDNGAGWMQNHARIFVCYHQIKGKGTGQGWRLFMKSSGKAMVIWYTATGEATINLFPRTNGERPIYQASEDSQFWVRTVPRRDETAVRTLALRTKDWDTTCRSVPGADALRIAKVCGGIHLIVTDVIMRNNGKCVFS
jgi:hypothetical protein